MTHNKLHMKKPEKTCLLVQIFKYTYTIQVFDVQKCFYTTEGKKEKYM